jgi:hypothetical protein
MSWNKMEYIIKRSLGGSKRKHEVSDLRTKWGTGMTNWELARCGRMLERCARLDVFVGFVERRKCGGRVEDAEVER